MHDDLIDVVRGAVATPPQHEASQIHRETTLVAMRDGVRLATDLYLPPSLPAPAVVQRTPYGRATAAELLATLAQHGYVVVSQDCRATGDSEPDEWDIYIYEGEDSVDCVEWITRQDWYDGFIGSLGGSYVAGTQWCMAAHPGMSAIAPEVGGLGVAPRIGGRLHMFVNAYARSVGKGADKIEGVGYPELERLMVDETLATGLFNEPVERPLSPALLERYPDLRALPLVEARRTLYRRYNELPPRERVELIGLELGTEHVDYVATEQVIDVFGPEANPDSLLCPRRSSEELARSVHAPALFITGWYDWGLDDTLATWNLLARAGAEDVRSRNRIVIAPSAHGAPGYHEGADGNPELARMYRGSENRELLVRWYEAVRTGAVDEWPTVLYYLMGANEWRSATAWPPADTDPAELYLGPGGMLTRLPPRADAEPDEYVYDPLEPTPTIGGSIVSFVYPAGSCDVTEVQARPDVLTYTTPVLEEDLDVVGPLRVVLHASSTAVDTDFYVRLSDVFPDGRAIQLQNGGLRARYRDLANGPTLLEPGRVYELEIDLWATANRFEAGHRLRLDVSSADFPRFDRNTNRGGGPGDPVPASQTIFHDAERPSRLLLSVRRS
jgi:predicted acyl esterase